ncbi:MAG: cell wall hydrolase [Pseudomonadota bacterium]
MRRLKMLAAVTPFLMAPMSGRPMNDAEGLAPLAVVEASASQTVTAQYDKLDDLVFATLSALPSDGTKEARCLAQAIYFEARSEDLEGQLAVAQVVLNRVADPRYPASVCSVVFQNEHLPFRCQFSFACDGRSDNPYNMQAWAIARSIAQIALSRQWRDLSGKATHYHAVYTEPYWVSQMERSATVGDHVFYRDTSF